MIKSKLATFLRRVPKLLVWLIGISVLLVAASALFGTLATWKLFGNIGASLQAFISPTPVAQVDYIGTRLRTAIVGARLQTNNSALEHEMRVVIENGLAGGYRASYRVGTTFEVGFDLITFEANDDTVSLNPETNMWTIRLPVPQVLSCSATVQNVSFEEWGVRTPSQMGPEARKLAEYEGLAFMRSELDANDQQFAVARNEARRFFMDILTPIAAESGASVEIEFAEPSDQIWVASCMPQVPACFEPTADDLDAWLWQC